LSKLCVEHVTEKYSEDSYEKVIGLWETTFQNRVKTHKGQELYPKLLKKLKEELKINQK